MVNAGIRVIRRSRPLARVSLTVVGGVAAAMVLLARAGAQVSLPTGENIVPVDDGWEANADGSFNLVFGYFNRKAVSLTRSLAARRP